jgi:hypothetical protein
VIALAGSNFRRKWVSPSLTSTGVLSGADGLKWLRLVKNCQ